MNYELQRELAEAGFPDKRFPGYKRGTNAEIDLALRTVHPTLEELIEACAPTEKWMVIMTITDKGSIAAKMGQTGEASTPQKP